MSAPASSASRAFSPCANTAILTSLPRPLGSAIVPRSCSSAWRTFRPVRTWTSTDSLNLAWASSLISPIASAGGYSRSRSIRWRASSWALPRRAITPPPGTWYAHPSNHLHAHRARRAGDDVLGRLDVVGVQVLHLALGDLAQLVLGDRAHLFSVGLGGALLQRQRLLDQN